MKHLWLPVTVLAIAAAFYLRSGRAAVPPLPSEKTAEEMSRSFERLEHLQRNLKERRTKEATRESVEMPSEAPAPAGEVGPPSGTVPDPSLDPGAATLVHLLRDARELWEASERNVADHAAPEIETALSSLPMTGEEREAVGKLLREVLFRNEVHLLSKYEEIAAGGAATEEERLREYQCIETGYWRAAREGLARDLEPVLGHSRTGQVLDAVGNDLWLQPPVGPDTWFHYILGSVSEGDRERHVISLRRAFLAEVETGRAAWSWSGSEGEQLVMSGEASAAIRREMVVFRSSLPEEERAAFDQRMEEMLKRAEGNLHLLKQVVEALRASPAER